MKRAARRQLPNSKASTDSDTIQALGYQDPTSMPPSDHSKDKLEFSVHVDVDMDPESTYTLDKHQQEQAPPKISFLDVFRYSSREQQLLNLLGGCMAAAAGALQPMMNVFIGKISTVFLQYTSALKSGDHEALETAKSAVYHTINSDALILLYLGIGMFFACMIYMAIFSYTSERIASNIKYAYLSALFNKSIDFFEHYGQGTVAAKIGSDVHLIQIGIGEKLPIAIMYLSTFIAAAAVAFSISWRLSLVLLPIAPLILLCGGVMGVLTKKSKLVELDCVAKAASRAEEAFNAIKVLKAFSKEREMGKEYDSLTEKTKASGAQAGRVQGVGVGALLFIIYSGYALAFF